MPTLTENIAALAVRIKKDIDSLNGRVERLESNGSFFIYKGFAGWVEDGDSWLATWDSQEGSAPFLAGDGAVVHAEKGGTYVIDAALQADGWTLDIGIVPHSAIEGPDMAENGSLSATVKTDAPFKIAIATQQPGNPIANQQKAWLRVIKIA